MQNNDRMRGSSCRLCNNDRANNGCSCNNQQRGSMYESISEREEGCPAERGGCFDNNRPRCSTCEPTPIREEGCSRERGGCFGNNRQRSGMGEQRQARNEGCPTERGGCFDRNNCDEQVLAMGYVKSQHFTNLYAPEKALHRGTLFADLDLPYGGCRK